MTTHSFSVSEAINTSRNATKKYLHYLLLLGIIAYLPSFISNLLTSLPSSEAQGIRGVIMVVVSLIAGIIGVRLGIGLTKTNLMILEDKKPTVKDLTSTPRIYVARLIWWWILVGIAVLLGFIALIIPGIYIATRLSLFQYFIAEWYGAIDAIKASRATTQGNVWNLIGIGFVYIGIALLWVLALVVGLLWALPTIMLAQAYVYTQLKHNLAHTIKPIN